MIRIATSLEAFLEAPQGACFEGEQFSFWNLGTVSGWRVWGAPGVADGNALIRCIGTLYGRGTSPYFSLVDLRRLESVSEPGFDVLRRYVDQLRGRMARHLIRQAVLKPKGLVGAMVAGFYVQLPPKHPVRVFASPAAAARWLNPPDRKALQALLTALRTLPSSKDETVEQLGKWLRTHLRNAHPATAARALGLSTRTLQRRLRKRRTTFGVQLRRVRVERAQQLLCETDWKIVVVADEVGLGSSQRLATTFRSLTHLTPTEFRTRHRARLVPS